MYRPLRVIVQNYNELAIPMTRPVMSFGHKHNDTTRTCVCVCRHLIVSNVRSVNGIITTVIFIVSGQRELTLVFLR